MSRAIPVGAFPHYNAIVDDEDYGILSKFSWHPARRGDLIYARTWLESSRHPDAKSVLMHKMITGFDQTDHKNRIGLDNRRENLRPATKSKNAANTRKRKQANQTSRFKGVSWHRDYKIKPWTARIKTTRLGSFATEEEAARAYDEAALELFGEFARVNFPE